MPKNFRLPLDHSWTPPSLSRQLTDSTRLQVLSRTWLSAEFRLRRINEEIGRIASALKRYIDSLSEEDWAEAGVLEVLRSYQRASMLSGGNTQWIMPSDVIRSVKMLYNQNQDLEACIRLGNEAIEIAPSEPETYRWLIRALTKLGRWSDAAERLEAFKAVGSNREYYFLRGFWFRYQGKAEDAKGSYERAFSLGMRGMAIHRELALAYFELGDAAKAEYHIGEAGRIDPSNRFLLDLRIKIACETGDESSARLLLTDLEIVDDRILFLHRASKVESRFGDPQEAWRLAAEAVELSQRRWRRPPFHVLAQFAVASIRVGKLSEAESSIDDLDSHYSRRSQDIRIGLRIELTLAGDQFGSAQVLWESLNNKSKPVHQALRRKILVGLLNEIPEWESRRRALEDELDTLPSLAGSTDVLLDPERAETVDDEAE